MLTEEDAILAVPSRSDSFLRQWVEYGAFSSDCNLAFHILGGLALLAQSLPKTFEVPFFGPPLRPGILFGLIVGSSTNSRKTVAIQLVQAAMKAVFPLQIGDTPGSVEGFVDSLAETPQQLIAFSEFASFLAQAEAKGYYRALKSKITEAYDGTPLSRKRANGKLSQCADPLLVILAAIAPGYLENHAEIIDFTEGYLARHLTLYCVRSRTVIDIPKVDMLEGMRAAAYKRLAGSLEWRSGKQLGRCRGLSPAANELWAKWNAKLSDLRPEGPARTMIPAIARSPAMVMKVAALLSWDFGTARTGEDWQISAEEMLYACKIVDLHVRSVMALGEYLTTDRDMRDRRRVLQVVAEAREPISFGQICKQAGLLRGRAKLIVETLQEEHTITLVDLGRNTDNGYALTPPDLAH